MSEATSDQPAFGGARLRCLDDTSSKRTASSPLAPTQPYVGASSAARYDSAAANAEAATKRALGVGGRRLGERLHVHARSSRRAWPCGDVRRLVRGSPLGSAPGTGCRSRQDAIERRQRATCCTESELLNVTIPRTNVEPEVAPLRERLILAEALDHAADVARALMLEDVERVAGAFRVWMTMASSACARDRRGEQTPPSERRGASDRSDSRADLADCRDDLRLGGELLELGVRGVVERHRVVRVDPIAAAVGRGCASRARPRARRREVVPTPMTTNRQRRGARARGPRRTAREVLRIEMQCVSTSTRVA